MKYTKSWSVKLLTEPQVLISTTVSPQMQDKAYNEDFSTNENINKLATFVAFLKHKGNIKLIIYKDGWILLACIFKTIYA